MGALLDQKYEKLFSLLDANGDGVIAEDDFTLMAARVIETFGDGPLASKGKAYADEMLKYWRALRDTADTDGDGQVDKDEFSRALHQVSDSFDTLVGPLYRAGFHLADRDDDGLVTKEEFTVVMVAIGVPPEEAGAAFDRLTERGGGPDGQLSQDQLMSAAEQFYRTEDPADTAGHLLFGTL
ncbi:EF-hand domain-containing protein [Streptomyces sp. NPDC047017]|uniref:EF-hand domain-containing protein n=1 Tax=Streptomyces sp. NPDC047017 TaxID=3155024 RepID=UPI0034084CCB